MAVPKRSNPSDNKILRGAGETAMSRCILVVSEGELGTEVQAKFLQEKLPSFRTLYAGSIESALRIIETESIDLVIADFGGKHALGLELLEKLRNSKGKRPDVVITRNGKFSFRVKGKKMFRVDDNDLYEAVNFVLSEDDDAAASFETFQQLVDGSIEGIAIIQDLKLVYANSALASILERRLDQMLGMTQKDLTSLLKLEDLEFFEKVLKESDTRITEQTKTWFSLTHKDGSVTWGELSTRLINYRGRQALRLSVQDISSHVEAEQQIIQSNGLFHATLDSTGDGILIVDDSGIVIQMNRKFRQLWYNPTDFEPGRESDTIFSHIIGLVENPSHFFTKIREVENSSSPDSDTVGLRDGRFLEVDSAPLIRDGRVIARLWSFRDITELKRAEKAATLYLDLMGHDIRNQLQGMQLSVDILKEVEKDDLVAGTLTDIVQSIDRCSEIISHVKFVEELSDAPMEETFLAEYIIECIEKMAADYPNVRFESTMEHLEARIIADKYLGTMFLHLVENAIMHNPKEDRQVWVRLERKLEGFEISIADNGPGMSDERKQTLFDTSRRFGGVGVHIASQIVEKYFGFVDVFDRVPGDSSNGAEIRIWFPDVRDDALTYPTKKTITTDFAG
ncbi:MAG: PAS domain S-box protein [Candidatus Thorarchaeota archaeon]|jgi:PAS domain S-box-containing protein